MISLPIRAFLGNHLQTRCKCNHLGSGFIFIDIIIYLVVFRDKLLELRSTQVLLGICPLDGDIRSMP